MTAPGTTFSDRDRATGRDGGSAGLRRYRWWAMSKRRLVVTIEPGAIAFTAVVGGAARRLGAAPLPLGARPGLPPAVNAFAPGRPVVELHLPATVALRKTLRLPAAARANLRAVLALEMDRETPFGAGAVVFDYRVLARDRGELVIDLLVMPRRALDPALEELRRLGLQPRRVTIAGSAGEGFDLTEAEPERAAAARPAAALVGLVLALALAVFGLDQWQAMQLAGRLERVSVDAEAALALRQRLAGPGQGPTDAAGLRQSRPSMTEVLAVLTRALPDGVWLERLSVVDGQLEITGLAPDAAALIPLLERTPPFRDVRFAGAVVRDMRLGRERFQISLALVPVQP